MITELNNRSREVFRYIVDSYLETGSPVGSRTISKFSDVTLSPASIRNIMADLEELGLLRSPHTSAGRIPTETGLRLYIDGLMEIGALSSEEQRQIETECTVKGLSLEDMTTKASALLSDLSSCASLVIAPKTTDRAVKQVQFIRLEPLKVLVVMVLQNGLVENRIMEVSRALPDTSLIAASNYLNAKLNGRTLRETQTDILKDIEAGQSQLDEITSRLVQDGLALPLKKLEGHIIVRGQSRLLQDVKAIADLERARALLSYLEEQENMIKLLESVSEAQGVQIYIGTQNEIFDQSGWSLVISPYRSAQEKIIGAIGVIGPTRLDYDRIIPMVDFTSKVITKLVEEI
jgi:heat-inducible transcriptional repressor